MNRNAAVNEQKCGSDIPRRWVWSQPPRGRGVIRVVRYGASQCGLPDAASPPEGDRRAEAWRRGSRPRSSTGRVMQVVDRPARATGSALPGPRSGLA